MFLVGLVIKGQHRPAKTQTWEIVEVSQTLAHKTLCFFSYSFRLF